MGKDRENEVIVKNTDKNNLNLSKKQLKQKLEEARQKDIDDAKLKSIAVNNANKIESGDDSNFMSKYSKKDNTIVKKSISFGTLLNFGLRNLFVDKTIVILIIMGLLLSFIFPVMFSVYKTMGEVVQMFAYYFIVIVCIDLFILLMRCSQFFWNSKMEDKTVYIIITQQVPRRRVFIAFWLTNAIIAIFSVTINYIMANIAFGLFKLEINPVFFRISTVYALYAIVVSLFLLCFFYFMGLYLKMQIATIIATFILAMNFIATLPWQFLFQQEKAESIGMKGVLMPSPYEPRITEVYNAFDLQQHVLEANIRFPHLSKYINDFFIENKFSNITFGDLGKSSEPIFNARVAFWEELGILTLDKENSGYKYESEKAGSKRSLTLASVPSGLQTAPPKDTGSSTTPIEQVGFRTGDKVFLKFSFKYGFSTIENLKVKIRQLEILGDIEKKQILEEFVELSEQLQASFTSEAAYKKAFNNLLDYYTIFTNQDIDEYDQLDYWKDPKQGGSIPIDPSNATVILQHLDSTGFDLLDPNTVYSENGKQVQYPVARIFATDLQKAYRGFYGSSIGGDLRFAKDGAEGFLATQNLMNDLWFPTLITMRKIENYFIPLTSNFIDFTENFKADLQSKKWNDYISRRNKYDTFLNFNLIANLMQNFTYFARSSSYDYWFDPLNDSYISFSDQENTFLPYVRYTFKIDDVSNLIAKDSYYNYTKPQIFIFVQIFIAFINYVLAIWMFKIKDLK